MRKMLVVLAALLLAATSAQAGFVLSLVDQATGLSTIDSPGTYTVDLIESVDAGGIPVSGDTDEFAGAQCYLLPLPAGWSVSGLTFNTVDFDPDAIAGSNLAGIFGIGSQVGYNTAKRVLSFTLVVPAPVTVGDALALDPARTNVPDINFGTITPGEGDLTLVPLVVTPEPATALLLIGALPFLRRRRA